jgi:DNA-binding transcriptional LysR family regulator
VALRRVSEEPQFLLPRRLFPVYYDYLVSALRQWGREPGVAYEDERYATGPALLAAGAGVGLAPRSNLAAWMAVVVTRPRRGAGLSAQIVAAYRGGAPNATRDAFPAARCSGMTFRRRRGDR